MKRRRASGRPSIRLAVVGCGAITRAQHLPALDRAGLRPRLFVDANIAKAEDLAAAYGGAEAASDITGIGARVDAALVAIPHSLHCPITVDLLGQGIHVLVEKPMALSRAECTAMIDAAAAADRVLAVGLTWRQYSVVRWLHSLIRQGDLGEIRSFHIWEGFRFSWPIESMSFFSREINGGGVLVDSGAHALDLADWLFGPLEVDTYADDSEGGVEADCKIEVHGPGSVNGTLELSRTRNLKNVLAVESSTGGLIVDLYGRTVEGSRLLRDLKGPIGSGSRPEPETPADAFGNQMEAWIAAIEGRESTCVTGAEAARSVGLIEDCYRARTPLVYPWEAMSVPADGAGDAA